MDQRPQESVEKAARPQKLPGLNCPRCDSTNTKFCYFNNYSLTQPRYFCKTCRRYWTGEGSLRNSPVGGGSRKNKRSSSSSSSSSSASSKKLPDLVPPVVSSAQNPKIHEGQDLNLSFPTPQDFRTAVHDFMQMASINVDHNNSTNSSSSSSKSHITSTSSTSSPFSALELLTGITSRGLNSFMPMPIPDPNTVYTSGFPMQDFKPALGFSLDGIGSGCGSIHGVQGGSNGWAFFPFEDWNSRVGVPTPQDFRTAVPLPEKPEMEEPASTEESDEKLPQSDSFKEDSTRVSDPSEMEKKSLEELKQLVLD